MRVDVLSSATSRANDTQLGIEYMTNKSSDKANASDLTMADTKGSGTLAFNERLSFN